MSKDLITEARELCAAATPGPWFNFGDWMIHTEPDVEQSGIAPEKVVGTVKAENAAFIARSRTIIPELCDALEKAEKRIRLLEGAIERQNNTIAYLSSTNKQGFNW